MITNAELFKKMMGLSRELRVKGIQGPVARAGESEGYDNPRKRHGMMESGMKGMEHGERPPMHHHDEMPPMHQHGRGPHGKGPHEGRPHETGERRGRGMSREHLLVLIGDHPEGVWQRDIAGEAGINASSTSELIAKLENDGFLIREPDENDKRAALLKLTEAGKIRADEIRAERESHLDELFSKLTDEEKQTLSDLLDKLMS